jgi:hypothetical protein
MDGHSSSPLTECVLNDVNLFVTQNGRSGRFFLTEKLGSAYCECVERVRIETPVNGATYVIHVRGNAAPATGLQMLQDAFPQNDNGNPDPRLV